MIGASWAFVGNFTSEFILLEGNNKMEKDLHRPEKDLHRPEKDFNIFFSAKCSTHSSDGSRVLLENCIHEEE